MTNLHPVVHSDDEGQSCRRVDRVQCEVEKHLVQEFYVATETQRNSCNCERPEEKLLELFKYLLIVLLIFFLGTNEMVIHKFHSLCFSIKFFALNVLVEFESN
jgi:hypothetical protein